MINYSDIDYISIENGNGGWLVGIMIGLFIFVCIVCYLVINYRKSKVY